MSRAVLRTLGTRLDGLAWLGMAGFMGWLTVSGDYWTYLNPKFKPVTLTAALVLAVLATYALLRPVARPSAGRTGAYLALAALIWLSQGGAQLFQDPADTDPLVTTPTLPAPEKPAPPPARLKALGREYIPINTVELFDIATNRPKDAWTKSYAMRGFVRRTPALDAKGEFVLFRLAIWCCFADSTAVGFRVKVPPGTPLPDEKNWLVVYGHLADSPPQEHDKEVIPGMPFSSISPSTIFLADALETASVTPEEVCVFEWRPAEPYAY